MHSITDPGVIERVNVTTVEPTPGECLPPGEAPKVTAELSPGWVAITDREILAFHPDCSPAVVRTPRHNVTGLTVRRAGGRSFLQYAPLAVVGGVVALLVGVGLLAVAPEQFITIPDAPGSESVGTVVEMLAWAMDLLGIVLVFSGILSVLAAIAITAVWLSSRDVVLVVERGEADPIERPTTQQAGRRAARTLGEELTG